MALDQAHLDYLNTHHQGRLATVAADGSPQNKPVGYRYNSELGTIDIGGFNMRSSAKYRNITIKPRVAFVVDDAIGEGANGMRMLEVRGRAESAQVQPRDTGVDSHIIRIHPSRVVSWNIAVGESRFRAFDLTESEPPGGEPRRPVLGLGEQPARAVVESFASGLQAGHDQRDAGILNRQFASDVIWGSPYGALIDGFDQLHPIHARFQQEPGDKPAARYQIRHVTAVSDDVIIAHIARVVFGQDGSPLPLGRDGEQPFSEMAMYVLVRRDGEWWLAAGQNTPIRAGGAVAATT